MENLNMDAIVLAGGLGTRLGEVLPDLPKSMASIGDRPFLRYLLDYLQEQGLTRVILATGHLSQTIAAYFGASYNGLTLVYSNEDKPLGTGGAVKLAMERAASPHCVIVNGDTLFKVDLKKMAELYLAEGGDLAIALKPMKDIERYGTVTIRDGRIVGFAEKKPVSGGLINGGIYIAKTDLLANSALPERFSFERDFLEAQVDRLKFIPYIADNYFIDIGVPADYYRAQNELKY